MERSEVLARRLQTQHLITPADPLEVITDAVGTQSQEYAHALWSVGQRSGASAAALADAYDRGAFLRTHVLRPTWHLVDPADARWLLRLTGPRVVQRCGPNLRRHALEGAELDRAAEIMITTIEAEGPCTRSRLATALAEAGLPSAGDRLAHVIIIAEQRQLLISGPMFGAQHRYARFEDRVPDAPEPDDPEAELTRRFLSGHGPASVDDLARWSSLTKTVIKAAVVRLGDRLARTECDGVELWFDPDRPYDPAIGVDDAYLLPLFDELTLSYPKIDFPVLDGHPQPPGTDLVQGSVIVGRRNVGRWQRTVAGRRVEVGTDLAPGLCAVERAAVAAAVDRLIDFLRGSS